MKLTQEVLDAFRFVCPACREKLLLQADGRGVRCTGCRRVYPVDDAGIPALIVEEAVVEGEETPVES